MTSLTLTNNAQSALAAPLGVSDTQLTVTAGQGARFPNPDPNEWFPLTLIRADGSSCEIVRAISRSGDIIEIVREQEGTTAVELVEGDFVLHQMTAAALLSLAEGGNDVIETSVGTSSAYRVSQPGIASLEDGLAFSFVAHATNIASATLQVGSLAPRGLRKYAFSGSDVLQALGPNEILLGRQVIVHYDENNGVFIVSNPNPPQTPTASATQEGSVLLANDPQEFDLDGNDSRVVTQKTASQIAQGAVDEFANTIADRILPFEWRDLGTGAGGELNVLTLSDTALSASDTHQFRTITVNSGGTLNISGRGVCVIRCTERFELNGTLNFPFGGNMAWPLPLVGPSGGVHDVSHNAERGECNSYPAIQIGRARPSNDTADTIPPSKITRRQVEKGILDGIPMDNFQGGNGATYRETTQSQHKGGLIIIAPEIIIGASAVINRMFPVPAGNFAGGSLSHGPGGGGMMVLVSENVTVDPSALFEAANESTVGSTDQHRTASQLLADPPAIPGPPGAANGALFTLGRVTNLVTELF